MCLGNVQNHTIQCVLVVNLLNEKAYLFVWFWLVAVLLLTAINTLHWVKLFS